ncbi:MAG: glycosyltransferase family 4 protein [Hyphomicrobiaceae bacterium]
MTPPHNASRPPMSPIADKALVFVTVDWFALSHFQPILKLLRALCRDVVVVTRVTDRRADLERLGVRVVDLDYRRDGMNPIREIATIRRITRILRDERPDIVHLIAMKPVALAGYACRMAGVKRLVVHMTGLGHLAISRSLIVRPVRGLVFSHLRRLTARPDTWLIVENPEDLAVLTAAGIRPGHRVSILPGAGVDPDVYTPAPAPAGDPPTVAYAGRMIHSKGVTDLVAAHDLLADRGIALDVRLYGRLDDGNPEAISAAEIEAWTRRPHLTWLGHVDDVREIWRTAGICVLPAREREGMPRALLEAAACGRPLVVTNVPGCRHFVRDDIEGLIVPPADPPRLADALARLAGDPVLRQRMGMAARERIIEGFTETHVVEAVAEIYRRLLDGRP